VSDRLSLDEYNLTIARAISLKGTCARRKVGCILINSRYKTIATGYNGVTAGAPHCIDTPCPGAACKSGEGLDLCEAIHAEQNALLTCSNIFDIYICYSTTAPCIHCIKLLLNTSCRIVVFDEFYPHPTAEALWKKYGGAWCHRPLKQ